MTPARRQLIVRGAELFHIPPRGRFVDNRHDGDAIRVDDVHPETNRKAVHRASSLEAHKPRILGLPRPSADACP